MIRHLPSCESLLDAVPLPLKGKPFFLQFEIHLEASAPMFGIPSEKPRQPLLGDMSGMLRGDGIIPNQPLGGMGGAVSAAGLFKTGVDLDADDLPPSLRLLDILGIEGPKDLRSPRIGGRHMGA